MEARLTKIRAKEQVQKQIYLKGDQSFKKRKTNKDGAEDATEKQFILDDYDSDDEQRSSRSQAGEIYSAETQALLEKLGMTEKNKEEDFDDIVDEVKVRLFFIVAQHSSSASDFLLLKNTFSAKPIYQRTSSTEIPCDFPARN